MPDQKLFTFSDIDSLVQKIVLKSKRDLGAGSMSFGTIFNLIDLSKSKNNLESYQIFLSFMQTFGIKLLIKLFENALHTSNRNVVLFNEYFLNKLYILIALHNYANAKSKCLSAQLNCEQTKVNFLWPHYLALHANGQSKDRLFSEEAFLCLFKRSIGINFSDIFYQENLTNQYAGLNAIEYLLALKSQRFPFNSSGRYNIWENPFSLFNEEKNQTSQPESFSTAIESPIHRTLGQK